jgi:hypothetical protein
MGQGRERLNKVTTSKDEAGQTNTLYEKGKILEHYKICHQKQLEAAFVLATYRKT